MALFNNRNLEKAERILSNNYWLDFKMNVTALNNYLECPLKFYYNSLIRIPVPIVKVLNLVPACTMH